MALLKNKVSYIAALIAVLLVSQGYYIADAIASTFVASVIALGGVYLLKDNVHYLVGKAPDKEFFEKAERAAKSVRGVLGVHELRAEYVGPNTIHAGLHVQVARGTPIEEADRITNEVEAVVGREAGCDHCVIHVEASDESAPRSSGRTLRSNR